jgi:hypothetical protein
LTSCKSYPTPVDVKPRRRDLLVLLAKAGVASTPGDDDRVRAAVVLIETYEPPTRKRAGPLPPKLEVVSLGT